MPNIQAITRDKFQHKRFKPTAKYAFTAQYATAPMVVSEMPKALLSLPIAFVADEGHFVLRALLGFEPGKNLFVAADGTWIGGYVPSAYRGYPFVLAELAGSSNGQKILCIDDDSGLLVDSQASANIPGDANANTTCNVGHADKSEAFFTENGELSPLVAGTLNFLDQVDKNGVVTQTICAALQKHAVIEPWPVTVQTETGEKAITGLHRINEAALNQLCAEALKELQGTGALLAAYCQLLSMQQLPVLAQIAQAHAKAAEMLKAQQSKPLPAKDLNLDFMSKGDAVSFDHLFKT